MTVQTTSLNHLNTAVLFLVYNRPDTTIRVFESIRSVRPPRLYVAADGPRPSRSGEVENVALVRKIATNVDWPCEFKTLYREHNLGCKKAVSSAIDWFFEHEEEGIILEDDCLPHTDFYFFCEKLLNYYRDEQSVAVITGDNFQSGRIRGIGSFYFSKYNHCWGWATWRRAWAVYDGNLRFWQQWKESEGWRAVCPDRVERRYWEAIFDQVCLGRIDSWAYPWTASVWHSGGLTATPNVNLVSNIGFGQDATHTHDAETQHANLPVFGLMNITFPINVVQDEAADRYVFDFVFGGCRMRMPNKIFFKILSVLRLVKFKIISSVLCC